MYVSIGLSVCQSVGPYFGRSVGRSVGLYKTTPGMAVKVSSVYLICSNSYLKFMQICIVSDLLINNVDYCVELRKIGLEKRVALANG